ncbi:MAG: extracellular solute-binding protein [Christensenellales bacterium]|jgi:putative aldouronate transport system substrate-binding protein
MKKMTTLLLALILIIALMPFAATAEEGVTTIRILAKTWSPYNPEETSIWDELAARTGVKIDWIWAPNTNYDEKVNTILASGDLPDVIYGATTSLLLNQGAIIPLDNYLAEYCPNYLALLTDADKPYIVNASDGHMYFMSHILDFKPSMSNMVRADWVKAAGMEIPNTWADWMAYWQWVRDNDANGNGDATDEIPLVVQNTDGLLKLGAWFDIKVNNSYFATNDEGDLVALFEHPNFRTYLETVIDLYKNGILDKEFATRGDTYKSVLDTSVAGSTYYYAERANLTTATLRDSGIEDGSLIGVVPPTYFEGTEPLIEARTKMYTYGLAVTVAAEERGNVEAIMKLWNYIYSEEGTNLLNYGIEGRHHTKSGDKFVYTDEVLSGGFTSARASGIIPSLINYNWMGESYMQILTSGKSYDELTQPMQYFYDALHLNQPYFYNLVPLFDTETYIEYGAEFKSKLTSIFAQCVVGELTVDDFYTRYEAIKAEGWQDIIDEQIAAYEKMMK